ncbi:acyl-CoA dehydrogenase family protein [Sphingomonas jatrophae]|uniref:Acyl-CoA dehydrogenase n=1 Tax=Sphingomonas jatrophae TaxID=1166337 RepID=A0A1I6KD78_9SPHN|nr:acyl-CoA dehydrogenase family protein [Sphingomonas jatrophae]SFR89146.1 Acyl-CoA dehydrogenase [Sphingomonas jatrophae]
MAVLTEEQAMLRDMASEWVRDRAPVTAARAAARSEQRYDPALWAEMAGMGWCGVLVPEAHGGADFGCVGFGIVQEELGRTLVASPLLSTALIGASAIRLGGSAEQQANWLPRIAAGEVVVALAVEEETPDAGTAAMLTAGSEGWRLDGRKTPVLDALAADLLIVSARDEDGSLRLVTVDAAAEGVGISPLDRLDGRDAATIDFAGVPVDRAAALDGGAELLEHLLDRGRAALAAEMMGTAAQAFETTLDYLKTRVQFGQLIGSFQALQHRAVAMQAELIMTRSAVEAALAAIDAGAEDASMLVSLAKALAGDTLRLIAREMVQMHGGIGMTEEHDAGLYFKRAAVTDATWGHAGFHRNRYARLAGY